MERKRATVVVAGFGMEPHLYRKICAGKVKESLGRMTRAKVYRGSSLLEFLDKTNVVRLIFRSNQVRSQLLAGENDLHIVREALN